ncbi:MAG: Mov34/MPN/PAD-1 family protein [Promethearchaeota archaeon]
MTIFIKKSEVTKIFGHGEATFPEECCGVLIGTSNPTPRIIDARRVRNTNSGTRNRRYNIDPQEYMSIEESIEKEGLQLLGIYHSHPDHPSRPSDFDLNHAFPNFSYMVLSVINGKAEKLTSWRLDPTTNEFQEEKIEIIE